MRRRPRKPPFPSSPPTPANTADVSRQQSLRERMMLEHDKLPEEVREAIAACPFVVHVKPKMGLNMQIMAEKIRNLKTFAEAEKFWKDYAR